jgi:predicted flap endonuclease-1-like 5' DNA nuclease
MPELNIIHIILLVITTVVGAVAGWVLRGNRAEQEKAAVNSGWQSQIEAQRREHDRLLDQNKSLMEQVSQFQAQHADAKNRAKELSSAVQEAYARRDELQREIKDIRGNLEKVLSERDQLVSDIRARDDGADSLQAKDERIEQLARELENWQNRLPPLIERFRVRNEEAERFEQELAEARARVEELEGSQLDAANQTQIEPVERPEELTAGFDASNDPDDEYVEDEAFADDDAEEEPDDGPLNAHDDLKMIKGVGPAIEKTLNEMGIISFRQIADMSEYDIDRIANRLKGFHTRIYREDWIGQARALLDDAANA